MESSSTAAQLQVRFFTKQEQFSVPDTTFALPSSVAADDLNSLINELLKESKDSGKKTVNFDFIALGEFVKTSLGEHITSRGGSTETVHEVEYLERLPTPQPQDCLLHDDWVSAVHVKGNWILTGCYDNTVHLWSLKGKHKLTIPGHTEAVKAVAFVSVDDSCATFISGSHDQTVLLWTWNVENNTVDSVSVCKGHSRSIECVAVSPSGDRFISGGWDSMLKVWSSDPTVSDEDAESESKRSKKSSKAKNSQTRTPLMTLKGHREAVTGACWRVHADGGNTGDVVTSSWDHTIRVWDVEVGASVSELATHKAMTDVHASPLSPNTLITSAADRHVRMLDTRTQDGVVVKCTYTSHTGWVQSVRWSTTDANLFISASYDTLVKLWDLRSPKVPLFDLTGHEDKALCCDWSNPRICVSGGADNSLRVFKMKSGSGQESKES